MISPPQHSEEHPLREEVFKGLPTAPGIAIGKAHLYRHNSFIVTSRRVTSGQEEEWNALQKAIELTRYQLSELKERLTPQVGESVSGIFDAQLMMLDDAAFFGEVKEAVLKEGLGAEWAVAQVLGKWRSELLSHPDARLHQRAQDLLDLCRRLVGNLNNQPSQFALPHEEGIILVADDLLPSDVMILLEGGVEGVVTEQGGSTSHTAILTRALQVPAVVGISDLTAHIKSGDRVVVNGNSGKVILRPEPSTLILYQEKREKYKAYLESLKDAVRLPAETKDGRRVALRANIELPNEVHSALSRGGEGVGLFRSEYLLLTRRRLPDEGEQEKVYRYILEKAYPHPVTIRTFDVGGDKLIPGVTTVNEPNPMVGWRAIRVGLEHPEILRTQLRAIFKASYYGKARVMIPFVCGIEEVWEVKEHIQGVKEELRKEGVPFSDDVPLGIMVEIPSAAIMAEELAKEVSFFSIGTNDLTQFLLAVDRGNPKVAERFQPFHPALLRLIRDIAQSAHQIGIEVGICGEMAANPTATKLLVGLDIDELSVSPVALPEIKKLIRSISYREARKMAEEALQCTTAKELHTFCWEAMKHRFANFPIWFD
ncbi:MAG: phosphoenolpyruvate--protein phosphotransferase [bacterium]